MLKRIFFLRVLQYLQFFLLHINCQTVLFICMDALVASYPCIVDFASMPGPATGNPKAIEDGA
jgi:hypothetical protein